MFVLSGVKRAAQRKLEHELGIAHGSIAIEDFVFLTRIHYVALSDPVWGEHEIDYILFAKKDVPHVINPNEINATMYVSADELRAHVIDCKAKQIPISPWFDLIAENFLYPWWSKLDQIMQQGGLGDDAVTNAIHRLNDVPAGSAQAALELA
jgi:isopentenyl-diphosphate delta-isomerase